MAADTALTTAARIRRTRLLRRAFALLTIALVMVACTGGDDDAAQQPQPAVPPGSTEVPDSFTTHTADPMTLSAPSSWTPTLEDDQISVVNPDGTPGNLEGVTAQVDVYAGNDLQLSLQGALDAFRLSAVDYTEEEQRAVSVTGADEAYLVAGVYGPEGDRTRQWDVFASVDGSTDYVYVSLKGPADTFDEALMAQILASVEVTL